MYEAGQHNDIHAMCSLLKPADTRSSRRADRETEISSSSDSEGDSAEDSQDNGSNLLLILCS